jgi:hypothetical protein
MQAATMHPWPVRLICELDPTQVSPLPAQVLTTISQALAPSSSLPSDPVRGD